MRKVNKTILSVPFFIRFDDLVKEIKERFGQDYEIVDIKMEEDGKWQVTIEIPSIYERTFGIRDIRREKGPQLLEKLKVQEIISEKQKQGN